MEVKHHKKHRTTMKVVFALVALACMVCQPCAAAATADDTLVPWTPTEILALCDGTDNLPCEETVDPRACEC